MVSILFLLSSVSANFLLLKIFLKKSYVTRFFFLFCLFLPFNIWAAASNVEDITWSHVTNIVTISHIPELESAFPYRLGQKEEDTAALKEKRKEVVAAVKNWAARALSAQVEDINVTITLSHAKSTLGFFTITHGRNHHIVKVIYGKHSQEHIAHCIYVDQCFVKKAKTLRSPEDFRLINLVDYGYAHSAEDSEENNRQELYFTLYQRAEGQDFLEYLRNCEELTILPPIFQKLGWALGKWVSENTVASSLKNPTRWRCATHGDFCAMNLFWNGEFFTLIDLEGIYDNAFPISGKITDDATYFFTVTVFFLKAIMEDTFDTKTFPLILAFAEYFAGSMNHYFGEKGMDTQNLRGYILGIFMNECHSFNEYLDGTKETHRLFPPKVDITEDNKETLRKRSLHLRTALRDLAKKESASNPYAL